jgi:hypothetical protein
LSPCDWLKVNYFDIDDDPKKRVVAAHLAGEDPDPIAAPDGWTPENSLSHKHRFVTSEAVADKMEFLRRENDVDVYLEKETGKEVFVGRTSGH